MMHTEEMLKVFATQRNDAIVIPGRGGRHWTKISERPNLDVPLGDPAMGGHAGFAFGLAMALPHRKIVLFDSEGDVQMALSVLITIAEQRPANFYHFMLDNECYATTGGQPVPNAKNVAYDLIARGAGYPRACAYDRLEDFAGNLADILGKPGPVFVALKVHPEVQNTPIGKRDKKWMSRTRQQAIRDLQQEVGIAV